ncbi:MAG: BLUF domain-containing protein, partial [Marinobacter nauticus]|nr:BLUF domain-containing protein [Marinobacter nauticus]
MRLAYASEATFEAQPLEKGVEPHVARILMVSRRNNGRAGLVGGLYYGDNRFFQYL